MNPIAFVKRRPLMTLTLVVALAGAVVFSLYKLRVEIPSLHTTEVYAQLDNLAVRLQQSKAQVFGADESKSGEGEEQVHEGEHKIVVTSPDSKEVVIDQKYVCQIHSRNHIEICALMGGYLVEVLVQEGQAVKKGDLMFKIQQTLYQARLDAKSAEAKLAELEFDYSKQLSAKHVVSENEVALKKAKLAQARAEAELSKAELNFTNIKAPFDGIVDRRRKQLGSLIAEGDILTTLSDNHVMWVYFNVPEADYLEYMSFKGNREEDERIELRLPGGSTFNHTGKIGAIEAKFNNETGNIAFRADFPNPDGLLRHGQTGTVVIHHVLKDAIVIPQRATFEILAKRYAYVVSDTPGDDHHKGDDKGAAGRETHGVVRQREIIVQKELDDVFVIQKGLEVGDRIILEGIRQVHDGEKVDYEFLAPEMALSHLKYHAE